MATVERFYHQMVAHRVSHQNERICPRYLGIDEHRFSKKIGFVTTFCNLERHSTFNSAPGRSEAELLPFLRTLQGRKNVKVVCMVDIYYPYRKMAKKWFPNTKIVTDRFHRIKLINQHFAKTCKLIDEERLAFRRGELLRVMTTRPKRLNRMNATPCVDISFPIPTRQKSPWPPPIPTANMIRHSERSKRPWFAS